MKKRIFSIATVVLLLVLALSVMVACGDKGNGNQNGTQTGGQEETPITSEVGLKYTVEESGLSENQWDTNHEFYASGDDVYYIAIKVTTGISGGMTIENIGL